MDSTMRMPTYHTSLIGRAPDVAAVTKLLRYPNNRVVTLVGASGSGKTRLALEVATSLSPATAGLVVFVALAPIQDARFVLLAIADMLGITEQRQESLLETLGRELADQHVLLILDNLEQVREAASDLGRLVAAVPHLTILATSQVALEIDEETIYPVPPLALPPDAMALHPAELRRYPSVALFVERLQMVQPRFKLDRTNADAVVAICRLLDGYPLAIELVAAHSSALSPADLLLLLRNHLNIRPHQKNAIFSSRTAILQPVLDWCTSRLPLIAQQLFRRIGVFLGGWTAEAAHAIMTEFEPAAVSEALAVLVQKHLVLIETLHGQQKRYVVLDAVRDYSASSLTQRAGTSIHVRHAEYYHALVLQAEAALQSAQQIVWFQRLDEEIHNIRTAMRWALDTKRPAMALQIVAALFRFWLTRSHFQEGVYWLDQALHAALDAAAADQAKAWKVLGVMAVHQGDPIQAQQAYDRAIALYAQEGDAAGLGATLCNRGILAQEQGQNAAARHYYEQSLATYRKAADPHPATLAIILNNLAGLCENQGHYAEALAYQQESLVLSRSIGDLAGIALSLLNLGVLHERQGAYEQARLNYAESMEQFTAVGDQQNRANCRSSLGVIALEQGDYRLAHEAFTEAFEHYRAVGNLYSAASQQLNLGYLAFFTGDLHMVASCLDAAHGVFSTLGAVPRLTDVDLSRSRLAYAKGDRTAAREHLQSALRRAREARLQPTLIDGGELAAILLADGGDQAGAVQLLAAVNRMRTDQVQPRSPSLARWYARYASQFQPMLDAQPDHTVPSLDRVIDDLEASFAALA